MKLVSGVLRGKRLAELDACGRCRFFENESRALELALPGLTSLSSADAAVRDRDGLCARHERLVTQRSYCREFEPAADAARPLTPRR